MDKLYIFKSSRHLYPWKCEATNKRSLSAPYLNSEMKEDQPLTAVDFQNPKPNYTPRTFPITTTKQTDIHLFFKGR